MTLYCDVYQEKDSTAEMLQESQLEVERLEKQLQVITWLSCLYFSAPSMFVFRGHLNLSSLGIPSNNFLHNICSACAVTVVIFEHKSFLLLTYLFTSFVKKCWNR